MTLRRLQILFGVLPLLWVMSFPMYALGLSDLLPASCVKVTSLSDLSEDGCYVFAAENIDGNVYLLSNEKYSKRSNVKLQATYLQMGISDTIVVEQTKNIWRIQSTTANGANTSYLISDFEGASQLYHSDKGTTDLTIDTSNSSSWQILKSDNGSFRLYLQLEDARYLGLYILNDAFWGYYTEMGANSCDIYIYRVVVPFEKQSGTAEKPTDGSKVVLSAADKLMADDLTASSNSGYLLRDGMVASDESLALFTSNDVTDTTFALSLGTDNFLNYNLETSSEPTQWSIHNGHITTVEETLRYLTYLPETDAFAVLSADAATTQKAKSVAFANVAEAPDSTSNDKGFLTLTGGWSADALAGIDLGKYSSVSLLNISLPVDNKMFTGDDATNTIIYVNAAEKDAVPADWRFVVVVDNAKAMLLRPTALIDRKPLCAMLPFTADAGQLSYTRTRAEDGNWETLCLPFDVKFPGGYDVETLKAVADNELTFYKLSSVEANTPVVFKPTTNTDLELTFTNAEQVEVGADVSPVKADVFYGNFDILSVTNTSVPIYMLSADGEYFVRAAQGSTLDAFRGYLQIGGKDAKLRVKFETSQIENVTTQTANAKCYDLCGRRCSGSKQKGVYITERKKLITR